MNIINSVFVDNGQIDDNNQAILTIKLYYGVSVTIQGLTFLRQKIGQGASVYIDKGQAAITTEASATLTFISCTFQNNQAGAKTSSVYADDISYLKIFFNSCVFSGNEGVITNDIYFLNAEQATFDGINWKDPQNYEANALFLYKENVDTLITIKNSVFDCTQNYDSTIIMQFDLINAVLTNSLFKIIVEQQSGLEQSSNQFSSNTYQKCNNGIHGGVFYLENGAQVNETGSNIQQNSALHGGVIFASGDGTKFYMDQPSANIQSNRGYYGGFIYLQQGAQAYITRTSFLYMNAYEGGLAYLIDRSILQMQDTITIKSCKSQKRGIFLMVSSSQLILNNATVTRNYAAYDSSIVYATNVREQYQNSVTTIFTDATPIISLITFSSFFKNEVEFGGRLMSIVDGQFSIRSCQFYNNLIYYDTMGIYITQATLWITNSTFYDTQKADWYTSLSNRKLGDMTGTFVSIGRNSTFISLSNSFYGGRALYGGCISIQGSSQSFIQNNTFSLCSANLGGAIYAVNFGTLVFKDCTFYNNIVFSSYAQNIYAQNGKVNLTIINTTFTSYHNSIFSRDIKYLYIKDVQLDTEPLKLSQIPLQEYSGGFHLINIQKIDMQGDNLLQNLKGTNGGALYIYLDLNVKAMFSPITYSFLGLTIKNCGASQDGGAIYLKNIQQITFTQTSITNNKAEGMGGGIMFFCNEQNTDVCLLNLRQTVIQSNTAGTGGGIRWNYRKPSLDSSSTVSYNRATIYGNDWASFPREIVLLTEDQYIGYFEKTSSKIITVTKTLTSYTYSNVQSGGFIPTAFFAIIDDVGQVVQINSGSMVQFSVLDNGQKSKQFKTQVSGVSKFFSTYGAYNISGLYIIAEPNSQQSLVMKTTEAIPLDKPTNQEYLQRAFQKSYINIYQIDIKIIMRPCIIGEGLRESGACYSCPKGTYLLRVPTTPTECKICPQEKAICNGGNNIGPKPGYWRKNNETDNFLECFTPINCLGMQPPENNPVGDCPDGYYGALCTACMPGYSRSGDYNCSKCPDSVKNLIRITGMLIALVLGISFMVKSTLSGATKKNIHSVYMKIIMNHLQMMLITASFKLEWPKQLDKFFNTGSPISQTTEAIVAFDCYMDKRDPNTVQRYKFEVEKGDLRVLYQKMMIIASLPILFAIISISVWGIILKIQKRLHQLEIRFVATLVILFFLVHPNITQTMVNMFNCQKFDGDLRLMKDLQVICYTDLHHIMALYVALPCLGLWGIGIPGAVWFLMSREREKLDTVATKQKFGFLYNGYKRDNYFWEIVLMYRKILCIFIAVFMNQIGVVVQALVILILLVFFLQLNNLRRPFASRNLNDTESMSLMTSIITIYCGIFYISSKDKTSASFNPNKDFSLDENGKMIFFCIIVLSNAMFLIFWVLKFVSIIRYLIKEKSLKLYVCLFLCCRQDKLDNENERIAKESKRETIIEKIEETQFFMKSMKNMYTRQIYYEGHQRFLKMLYYIEQEKPRINMTEKKHNFYIQGKMARDRKFDPERMKEILDQRILSIDEEFGGNPNGQRISNAMPQEEQENFSAQIFQQKLKASNANSIMPEEEFKRIGDDGQKLYARKRRSSMKKKFILDQTGSQSNLEETKDPSQLINELETDMNASRLDETNRFLIPQFSSKGVGRDIDFNVHQQEEDLEEQKKKEMLERQDIQTRLMRSRNADVKLNKSKQSRIFLDDVDDDEPSNEDATPKINDDFFNDGIGFVKEKVFASQESSQQSEEERKLMRQLTKRLEKNNDSKAKGIQQKLQGGKVSEQQLKRGKTKEYEVGHISQIQSPQDKQNHENNQSIKVLSQKQSQKLLTQEEALKLAEMSKEMRKKKLEYKEFLRPDGQLRRQIMIDNFCVIKETRGNPNKLQKISDVKLGQQQQKKRNEESENENEDEKQDNDDGEELKEEDSKLNVDLLTIDLLDDFEKAMKPSKQGKLTQKVLAKRKLKKLLTKVGRFYAGNYIPPKSSKSEDDSSTIKTDSSFGEYAKVFDEDKMILKTEPEQLVDMLEEADSPLTRMLKKQIKKKLVQSPIVNKFDTEESKH